jgi:hypothetical protein
MTVTMHMTIDTKYPNVVDECSVQNVEDVVNMLYDDECSSGYPCERCWEMMLWQEFQYMCWM